MNRKEYESRRNEVLSDYKEALNVISQQEKDALVELEGPNWSEEKWQQVCSHFDTLRENAEKFASGALDALCEEFLARV